MLISVCKRAGAALVALLLSAAWLWHSARPALAVQVPLSLDELTQMSDRIVTGKVVALRTEGNAERRGVYTYATVLIHDHVKGKPDVNVVKVAVPGGTVGDLTLHVGEAPEFAQDESVMVFLKLGENDTYDVVGWEQGKFQVGNGMVSNHASGFQARAGDFVHEVNRRLNPNAPAASNDVERGVDQWAASITAASTPSSVSAQSYVSNNAKWPASSVTFVVNPANGDIAASAALSAIQAAATTWNNVPTANFDFVYGGATTATSIDPNSTNGKNEVIFVTQTQNGTLATTTWWTSGTNPDGTAKIIEADMVINDAYAWSTSPTGSQFDLQSVSTHEFGHMLSLGHDSDSNAVMYFSIANATVKRTLYSSDVSGINALYPGNAASATATPALPTATRTPVPPTATRTAVPSPTRTPTVTPILPSATLPPVLLPTNTAMPTVAATVAVKATATAVLDVVPAPCCDYNGDGVVTVSDVQVAASQYGTNDPTLDFNRNGSVDQADVGTAAARWHQSGTTAPLTAQQYSVQPGMESASPGGSGAWNFAGVWGLVAGPVIYGVVRWRLKPRRRRAMRGEGERIEL